MEVQVATDASSATQAFAFGCQAPLCERARLTPIARAEINREPKSSLEMTCVLGRPTMKMKPMLGDETEAGIPRPSFAAVPGGRRAPGGDGGALRPRRPETGVGITVY